MSAGEQTRRGPGLCRAKGWVVAPGAAGGWLGFLPPGGPGHGGDGGGGGGGVPGGASSRASRVAQLWGEKVEVGWTECWGLELTNVGTLYHYLLTGQTDK